MLKRINKLSETTISGKRVELRGLNLSQPEMTPLRRLGIASGILATVEGRYKLVRGDNEPLHTNFLYVIEGEVEVETSVGDWVATPGTLIRFPSSVSRRIELRSGPRYREMFFKVYHTAECDVLKADAVSVYHSRYADILLFALERCIEESWQRDDHSLRLLASYAEIMAVTLHREVQAWSGQNADHYKSRLSTLWDEVMDDLASVWMVERLAAKIPISPTHFHRLVQTHYGRSPKQYVTRLRMEKARSLLNGTNHSIDEIAHMVGYANEFSFSNVFLKHVGQRPGRFRKGLADRVTNLL